MLQREARAPQTTAPTCAACPHTLPQPLTAGQDTKSSRSKLQCCFVITLKSSGAILDGYSVRFVQKGCLNGMVGFRGMQEEVVWGCPSVIRRLVSSGLEKEPRK
eukprot:363978-Chlamydomonas_euryale.AAC.10